MIPVVLLDQDNWLRTGRASVTSAPPPVVGYSLDALTDGVQAIPYRGVGIAAKDIEITLSAPSTLAFLSIHDVRMYGGDIASISIDDYRDGAYSTRAVIPGREVEVSYGSVGAFSVFRGGVTRVRIRISGPSAAEFSIGEICLGNPTFIPDLVFRVPPRTINRSVTWDTVENGPWRTKLAEPRRTFVLDFPPGREEYLEELMLASEGGLRPVSMLPDWTGSPAAIHGHFSDEYSSTLELGGIYQGRSLQVQESMRPLRG
mgnify:FL=1